MAETKTTGAPDAEAPAQTAEAKPKRRRITKRKAVEEHARSYFAAVPALETTVTRVVAGERQAAVEWRMTGHFSGAPFQGVDATGRRVEMRGLDLFEIEDGEIVGNS